METININMDEDLDTDSDSDSDLEIEEADYIEIETSVYELVSDVLADNVLAYSDPDFHENLIEDVLELYHNEWNNIINAEQIDEIIKQIVESFFDISEEIYPRRSISDDRINTRPNLLDIARQIAHLQQIPQPTQRSLEWYQYRHGLITASNIWKVFSSEAQRNSLIFEKCKPFNPFASERNNWHGGGSLQWGVLYEQVSVMIYERKFNTRVSDFGCIQHQKYSYIGASPDGINVDPTSDRYGRMLEIKNIVNREITGIPKEEYWVQMQVQMETCDLNECDFLETRFKEYANENEFREDTAQEWKGVILCFIERDTPNSKPTYKYMPFDRIDTVDQWIGETKTEVKDTLVLYTTTYWYLDELSCVLVKRNRLWFESALPLIKETWDTIVIERETGYEHRMAKKRVVPNDITIQSDNANGTYVINNLKFAPNICLVKLD